MAEKKKSTAKKATKAVATKKESKWTTGKGVPVDSKKIKWAVKY